MSKPPSKVVFVGNIPYGSSTQLMQIKFFVVLMYSFYLCATPLTGLSEEQIIDIFSSAGRVLNFRLVYDKETGRPKGFGFAEYPDTGLSHYVH